MCPGITHKNYGHLTVSTDFVFNCSTFNQTLSWNENVQSIKPNLSKSIGITRKVKPSVATLVRKLLFTLTFHTVIAYSMRSRHVDKLYLKYAVQCFL